MAQDFAKKKSPSTEPTSGKKSTSKKTATKKAPKRKTNNRKAVKPKKKAPLWAWLLIGIFVMGFALFLAQISNKDSSKAPAKTSLPTPKKTAKNNDSQVRFDFYKILKGHEVKVDERVIENTPNKSNTVSWLQVASFRNIADADQLRAKLLLVNLNASTEETTNKKQEVWHRVMVGPFTSRSKLAKARSILASNNMNSFVIKRKANP